MQSHWKLQAELGADADPASQQADGRQPQHMQRVVAIIIWAICSVSEEAMVMVQLQLAEQRMQGTPGAAAPSVAILQQWRLPQPAASSGHPRQPVRRQPDS